MDFHPIEGPGLVGSGYFIEYGWLHPVHNRWHAYTSSPNVMHHSIAHFLGQIREPRGHPDADVRLRHCSRARRAVLAPYSFRSESNPCGGQDLDGPRCSGCVTPAVENVHYGSRDGRVCLCRAQPTYAAGYCYSRRELRAKSPHMA